MKAMRGDEFYCYRDTADDYANPTLDEMPGLQDVDPGRERESLKSRSRLSEFERTVQGMKIRKLQLTMEYRKGDADRLALLDSLDNGTLLTLVTCDGDVTEAGHSARKAQWLCMSESDPQKAGAIVVVTYMLELADDGLDPVDYTTT